MALTPVQRAAVTLAAPTLDANGLPTKPWQPTVTTRTGAWGVPRITVGGTDITEYRSKRTIPERWSYVKPHWFGDATIFIPQLPPYEALPAWCAKGKAVKIERDTTGGGVISTAPRDSWLGYVTTISDRDGGTELTCQGLYQQPDLYRRAPGLRDESLDVGHWFAFNLDPANRPAYRWPSAMVEPTTGELSNYRGSWESVLEYLKTLSALIPGWTLRPMADFSPQLVDTAVIPGSTWTLRFARDWVAADLTSEMRGSPNVIYGEGTVGGVEWRRMIATAAGDAIFIPLSADPVVNTYWMDAGGDLLVDATSYDSSVLRYEAYWKLPPNMTMDEAVTLADAYRTRVADPGWAGTVSTAISPAEGHLLDIRPDDVLHLQGYRGADRDLYVAEASFDWNDGAPTVSLVVDSNARDLATLTHLLGLDGNAPNFDAATNPFHRMQIGKDSGIVKDRTAQWDFGGSGWVPNDETDGRRQIDGTSTFPVTGGAWTVKKFLASERDTIARSEIVVTTTGILGGAGRRFVAAVLAAPPSYQVTAGPPPVIDPVGLLPDDPLADNAWPQAFEDDPDLGRYFQVGWGAFGDAMGYWPGYEDQSAPLTGHMLDETRWSYSHDGVPDDERQPAYLWLCVWTVGADAECWARFVVDKAGA
jgi:hypothetical protein